MNKEEFEQEQNKNKNDNQNSNQNGKVKDADQHNLEEKLEDLLKMGWIMLPESCTLPCIY